MTIPESPVLSRNYYVFLFGLLGLITFTGLFIPLMDNDAAHHANIALRMYLTGDYVNLMDGGADYLDKPHLHFWLSAFSFKLFGVNSFAYKFPSFLFSILGVYSVFKTGKLLYGRHTGKLAALIIASSFSFMLANSDVRMDAIITSTIAFSFWQLAAFIYSNKPKYVFFAAFGLALGFSTKGMIAVGIPLLGAGVLALQKKGIRAVLNFYWLLLILLFFFFISPVLYCYYLQFNLHPEKMIRGQDHIDGISFILFNQNVERFSGGMGQAMKQDRFFFLHSFLWSFAPWCLLAFVALASRIRNFQNSNKEWASPVVFFAIALLLTLSGFKLPHYLVISFPFASLFTAAYIVKQAGNRKREKRIYLLQLIISIIGLAAVAVLNFLCFQVNSYLVMAGVILLLSVYFHFLRSSLLSSIQKAVGLSVAAMLITFFLLNTNFYPRLLTYQGGNELASATKGKIDPAAVYFWPGSNSASFDFYTATLHKEYTGKETGTNWLVFYPKDVAAITKAGVQLINTITIKDYEVTRLDLRFLDPELRDKACSTIMLAEIVH